MARLHPHPFGEAAASQRVPVYAPSLAARLGQRLYLEIYRRMPLGLLHRRGDVERQLRLLPRDISKLVPQVLRVPTAAIRWGGRPPRLYRKSGLWIEDGDWDLICRKPIAEYLEADAYGRSIRQLFVEGRRVEDTDQYRLMVQRLQAGDTPKGCRSLDEIHACFADLLAAHRSILREGYLSQVELGRNDPTDEIMVYVDREGDLHKQQGSGHHRLAVARLLKVRHVPICVLGVHAEWALACCARHGEDVVDALSRGLRSLA